MCPDPQGLDVTEQPLKVPKLPEFVYRCDMEPAPCCWPSWRGLLYHARGAVALQFIQSVLGKCQAPLYLTLYREAWTCANESARPRYHRDHWGFVWCRTWGQALLLAAG